MRSVCVAMLALFCVVSVAAADQPAALSLLDSQDYTVMSTDTASEVRALGSETDWFCFSQDLGFDFGEGGYATGGMNFKEGVYGGELTFTQYLPGVDGGDPSKITAKLPISGLAGSIGIKADGSLDWSTAGKAVSGGFDFATDDFGGDFNQHFGGSHYGYSSW